MSLLGFDRPWVWLGLAVAITVWFVVGRGRRVRLPESLLGGAEMPARGSYVIVAEQSTAFFTVRKLGLWSVHGRVPMATGMILVPGDGSSVSVTAVVPTVGLDTGIGTRDRHLLGPGFFDVERSPFLRFVSDDVRIAHDSWSISGVLTVCGVQRQVTLTARAARQPGEESRWRIQAETTVRRSNFGLSAMTWLAGDHVRVLVDIVARAAH